MELVCILRLVKTTVGAYKYQEVDHEGNIVTNFKHSLIGSLYIRKDRLETPPEEIAITITSR